MKDMKKVEAIFLDSKEIADFVKIGVRDIKLYKLKFGLPAFQEQPIGKWKARKRSLIEWAEKHEWRYVGS
ncbi:MAG: hypothetical protein GY874_17560 [Desulfobacteraceae bacterium]|nr:hypothetical protein [Desulfobacteraceae bacterium]